MAKEMLYFIPPRSDFLLKIPGRDLVAGHEASSARVSLAGLRAVITIYLSSHPSLWDTT